MTAAGTDCRPSPDRTAMGEMRRFWSFAAAEKSARLHLSSRLLWLTAAALSVSAGGSSKQEKRWCGHGSEPQFEALSKRQEADSVRCNCRAVVLPQNPLRWWQWPRSALPGLLGRRCCARDRSRARRRALRPRLRQGVPVPRRRATPLAWIEDNPCESWPRPAQTVAQQGPPYSSACRIIFHGGQIVMTTDILRCHPAY
jgi:hypothetical protein